MHALRVSTSSASNKGHQTAGFRDVLSETQGGETACVTYRIPLRVHRMATEEHL